MSQFNLIISKICVSYRVGVLCGSGHFGGVVGELVMKKQIRGKKRSRNCNSGEIRKLPVPENFLEKLGIKICKEGACGDSYSHDLILGGGPRSRDKRHTTYAVN